LYSTYGLGCNTRTRNLRWWWWWWWCNSTALRPFDDLRYGPRPTCVRAATLRPGHRDCG